MIQVVFKGYLQKGARPTFSERQNRSFDKIGKEDVHWHQSDVQALIATIEARITGRNGYPSDPQRAILDLLELAQNVSHPELHKQVERWRTLNWDMEMTGYLDEMTVKEIIQTLINYEYRFSSEVMSEICFNGVKDLSKLVADYWIDSNRFFY